MSAGECRFCKQPLSETFVDLGMSPLSNAFLQPQHAAAMEKFYPLHAYVCGACHLVQVAAFEKPRAYFQRHLYFSSYAESWLRHVEIYARTMIARFGIGPSSEVVEIASNDGYLLQFFHRANIPVFGSSPPPMSPPWQSKRAFPPRSPFWPGPAERLRAEGHTPDLIVANTCGSRSGLK